jgi:hypothetical protein
MPASSAGKNRSKIRKAREELRALPPERREDLIYDNIDPGDSYVGMWTMVKFYLYQLKTKMQHARSLS